MARHWVENLPEVGTPFIRKARELDEIDAQIDRLKAQIKTLKGDKKRLESKIEDEVRTLWSAEEIWEAKYCCVYGCVYLRVEDSRLCATHGGISR